MTHLISTGGVTEHKCVLVVSGNNVYSVYVLPVVGIYTKHVFYSFTVPG